MLQPTKLFACCNLQNHLHAATYYKTISEMKYKTVSVTRNLNCLSILQPVAQYLKQITLTSCDIFYSVTLLLRIFLKKYPHENTKSGAFLKFRKFILVGENLCENNNKLKMTNAVKK